MKTRAMHSGNSRLVHYLLIAAFFLIPGYFSCSRIASESNKETGQRGGLLNFKRTNSDSTGCLYDLDHPDKVFRMPDILDELSGICLIDPSVIAAVQDERGAIFFLDTADGRIQRTLDFAGTGDYEDIAYDGNRIYVLESNGTIFEVVDYVSSDPQVIVHKTRLDSRNDCEGLAFSSAEDALLIACKGSPSIDKANPYHGFRAVYRYSLEHHDVDEEPFFLINPDALPLAAEKDRYEVFSDKMASMIDPHGSILFQPSGISVHPLTNHLYILSHVGKKLVILDHDGLILRSLELNPRLLPQPEGICFGADGTLYLGSEGSGSDGIIAVYKPKLP